MSDDTPKQPTPEPYPTIVHETITHTLTVASTPPVTRSALDDATAYYTLYSVNLPDPAPWGAHLMPGSILRRKEIGNFEYLARASIRPATDEEIAYWDSHYGITDQQLKFDDDELKRQQWLLNSRSKRARKPSQQAELLRSLISELRDEQTRCLHEHYKRPPIGEALKDWGERKHAALKRLSLIKMQAKSNSVRDAIVKAAKPIMELSTGKYSDDAAPLKSYLKNTDPVTMEVASSEFEGKPTSTTEVEQWLENLLHKINYDESQEPSLPSRTAAWIGDNFSKIVVAVIVALVVYYFGIK